MKPGHFKKKKGSKYYSSVQLGSGLSRFVDNFPIIFTAKNNFSELLLYTNENWENHLLLAYIRQFKKSRANVFPASLSPSLCNSCFATTFEPKGFISACIACSECWQECKGNVKFAFKNRTLSVWILITRKQALFTLNNNRWQNGKKKVHLSVLLIRPPAWMFLAGENKQLKAASVIQDTKENIVKHVSNETTIEQFYCRRCQTKYMTIKCNEDGGNFQLGTPF